MTLNGHKLDYRSIISTVNLLVMVSGLFTFFVHQSDQQEALQKIVNSMQQVQASQAAVQNQQAVALAEIRAKVEVILPTVQKIEDQQRAPPR